MTLMMEYSKVLIQRVKMMYDQVHDDESMKMVSKVNEHYYHLNSSTDDDDEDDDVTPVTDGNYLYFVMSLCVDCSDSQ